ncbi:hypothetical protein [Luteipulveratus halotolerans]|uniref:Uncharacterized protein n=1 Tax=Luteipulveratus halotolerans TaxID=1631356 RepID=A0A0L6CGJ8_9MICO|nr:hypothetical protein [Luteipulveratus halotolerans]KNX36932.1 hypothetical protein VV01_06850 [Luteipulveratus halotolerans]
MPAHLTRLLAVLLLAAVPLGPTSARAAAAPEPPTNPYLGPVGTATMHGDAGSSDVTPYAGPGASPSQVTTVSRGAACPTILIGSDGLLVSLCTRILGRTPVAQLSAPDGRLLAELELAKGSLLGGVYAFLDRDDRLVVVDGHGDLLRIAHARDAAGRYTLAAVRRTPLASVLGDDAVVGLVPDWSGRVVMATAAGRVLVHDGTTGSTHALTLGVGERIDNTIASSPAGALITTSHATYLVRTDRGVPTVRWRAAYDRGSARKPGQLSWGSGATPTFFGPRTGADYVAITDNARPQAHALVYAAGTGRLICWVPVLTPDRSGSENSPIGYDRSVYVASTYGYPYPAYPDGAGTSDPVAAPFTGGMERIDVDDDGQGCHRVWANEVRSAAVPRLSTADGLIYTTTRDAWGAFRTAAIDSATGELKGERWIGWGLFSDSLQMVGSIAPDGTQYQGTVSGFVRIRR